MPTTKQRINITVDKDTNSIIKTLARRDNVSKSRKVMQLLFEALDLQEDLILAEIADKRRRDKNAKYISHDVFWKKIQNSF